MKVYKTCFRVIEKNIVSMLIYLFVFIILAVLLTTYGQSSETQSFTTTKTRVAFFSDDGNTPLVSGFKEYLSENAQLVSIPDNLKSRQDALFYENVDYIVRVPKGFTQNFLSGDGTLKLERSTVPDSTGSISMDSLVNRYFSLASLYKNVSGITQSEIVSDVKTSLSARADVSVHSFGRFSGTRKETYFFRYLAYVLMAVMILGVTSIMLVFNNADLRRRTLCSPMNILNMNLQLVAGNLTFTLAVWAIMSGFAFVLCGKAAFSQITPFFMLNALVFTLVCLSLAFLVGSLIKSKGAQSAMANVLSLGTCFISGVFVPQELLGKTVRTIASFLPNYWYMKAVNDLNSLSSYTPATLQPVFGAMLIQLGFAVTLLAVALVIAKQKRTGEDSSYDEEEA